MSKRRVGIGIALVGLGALAFAQPWRKPFSWERRLPPAYQLVETHPASMLRAAYFGEDAFESRTYLVHRGWAATCAELRRRFPTLGGRTFSSGETATCPLSGLIDGRQVILVIQTVQNHDKTYNPNLTVVHALGENVTPPPLGRSLLLALQLDRLGVVQPRPVYSF